NQQINNQQINNQQINNQQINNQQNIVKLINTHPDLLDSNNSEPTYVEANTQMEEEESNVVETLRAVEGLIGHSNNINFNTDITIIPEENESLVYEIHQNSDASMKNIGIDSRTNELPLLDFDQIISKPCEDVDFNFEEFIFMHKLEDEQVKADDSSNQPVVDESDNSEISFPDIEQPSEINEEEILEMNLQGKICSPTRNNLKHVTNFTSANCIREKNIIPVQDCNLNPVKKQMENCCTFSSTFHPFINVLLNTNNTNKLVFELNFSKKEDTFYSESLIKLLYSNLNKIIKENFPQEQSEESYRKYFEQNGQLGLYFKQRHNNEDHTLVKVNNSVFIFGKDKANDTTRHLNLNIIDSPVASYQKVKKWDVTEDVFFDSYENIETYVQSNTCECPECGILDKYNPIVFLNAQLKLYSLKCGDRLNHCMYHFLQKMFLYHTRGDEVFSYFVNKSVAFQCVKECPHRGTHVGIKPSIRLCSKCEADSNKMVRLHSRKGIKRVFINGISLAVFDKFSKGKILEIPEVIDMQFSCENCLKNGLVLVEYK
ncbi:MAG: hypothetical protein QM535_15030, partial [Limnohabitans sp.]|nr:hypothetical protein [Limnohabitans sp.]